MPDAQPRYAKPEELRRRLLGVGAACAVGCVAVVAGGMVHSIHRQAVLGRFLEERVQSRAHALELVVGKLTQSAQLVSLSIRAGDAVPTGQEPIRHFVLERDATGAKVTGESPNALPQLVDLFERMRLRAGDQQSALWPPDRPKLMVHCVGTTPERTACSSLSLDALLRHASSLSTRLTVLEVLDHGRVIARTSDQPLDAVGEAAATLRFGDADLTLVAKVDSAFGSEFGIYSGRMFMAWAVAGLLLLVCFLAWRYRVLSRQLALVDAVERTRVASDVHARSTLELVAQAGRLLLWVVHQDRRVELFGPWEDEVGVNRESVSLERLAATLVNCDEVLASLLEALANRTSWSRVYVRVVDGEELTFQSHGVPYSDAQGNFIGLLGIASNITEALKAQGQAMREEAYRAAQTGILRHMTKEVSAPAMHIQAVVDLFAREFGNDVDTDRRRLLNLAAQEARWLSEVVRSSLELMNLRGANVLDDLKPVSVDQVVDAAVADVSTREAEPRGQRIVVSRAPDLVASTHASSLRALLSILLTNACRYSPDGSAVLVRTYRDGPVARIEIEDEGPGIGDDEMQRIGEPFFRGESSISIPGSGLGLATAFELARVIRGDIRLQRSKAPEGGLLVRVSVPLRQ